MSLRLTYYCTLFLRHLSSFCTGVLFLRETTFFFVGTTSHISKIDADEKKSCLFKGGLHMTVKRTTDKFVVFES